MAKVAETNEFSDVPLLEVTMPIKGGVGGAANMQAMALANRTLFLKDQVTKLQDKFGNNYNVVTLTGEKANQSRLFYFDNPNNYLLSAFALKLVTGASAQTFVIDKFITASKDNYLVTEAVNFTTTMNAYLGETFNPVLNTTSSFYEYDLKAATAAQFTIKANTTDTIVPLMTAANVPTGYVASASTTFSSAYAAYFAFAAPQTDQTVAWVSTANTNATKPDWLQIEMPIASVVTGYSITNRRSGTIQSPNTWKLQGSTDGTTWVDLHTVTNNTINTAGTVRPFTPTAFGNYRFYRIYVTVVNAGGVLMPGVIIGSLKLYTANKYLIKDKNGNFYTSANGTLTKVTNPTNAASIENTGFTNSGSIPNANLKDLVPIKLVTGYACTVTSQYLPMPQIAIQKIMSSAEAWGAINSSTLTSAVTGSGAIKIAVTKDGTNWFAFNGTSWISVGVLTNDTASATLVMTNGMTPSTFNALTNANWALFYDAVKTPGLGFAYAFTLSSLSDTVNLTDNTFNIDESSSWQVQSPTNVIISWRDGNVVFKPIAAGDYKYVYQIPK